MCVRVFSCVCVCVCVCVCDVYACIYACVLCMRMWVWVMCCVRACVCVLQPILPLGDDDSYDDARLKHPSIDRDPEYARARVSE
jgi:hypothetical protein